MYGKDLDNVTIAVDEVEMKKILREEGDYAVLELKVEGDQSYHVMVYDVQKDPIKDNLVHIDFKTIRMDEPVNSEVTIELTGEAAGVKEGEVLQQLLRAFGNSLTAGPTSGRHSVRRHRTEHRRQSLRSRSEDP